MAAEVGWPAQCDWDRPYSPSTVLSASSQIFDKVPLEIVFIRRLTDVDSMGAMKTIMEGFLDDYNMSDLLYHRQRVLNAKISPLQVHQLSGFQERVRCFDTGRLLCLSQRPLRPEMVQTHFKVYLISSVCAPENVLQTKRERKRVAKKVFVQISSMSVSEFLVPSCSRAGSAQFCYHVL